MAGVKCTISVVAITLIIPSGQLISTEPRNGTTEILRDSIYPLSVMRRQNHPTESQLYPERFSEYTGPIKPKPTDSRDQFGFLTNPIQLTPAQNYPQYYQNPNYPTPPAYLPVYHPNRPQSITDTLGMITKNDDLQCIPRLLCEFTSNPRKNSTGNQRQSTTPSFIPFIPFGINLQSVVDLVTALSGVETSPIISLGKAVFLGYTSKGNMKSCMEAYPHCPQEADQLVNYLNNHNGGFFRLFNGLPNPSLAGHPYPTIQGRIVNNASPSTYVRFSYKDNGSIKLFENNKGGMKVVFPRDKTRQIKQLNKVGFHKPFSHQMQMWPFFPIRTGTGELRLDSEELNDSLASAKPIRFSIANR